MQSLINLSNFESAYFCNKLFRTFTTCNVDKRICIVGGGPAGFCAAQYLVKYLPDSYIDIIEKLPVPFGLVRYGVAPDHPEVKNIINTFTKTAENSRVRYFGNLAIGKQITLQELRDSYHAVILSYGAEKDKKLNLPNEENSNILSAREFVAWYNGLPGYENLNPNLNGEILTVIGQGNVAMDVSRIVLTSIDSLKKTDITEYALATLSKSNIKKVNMIGRRGPLQAAFTIKELREMLKLPNVSTKWRSHDFIGVNQRMETLTRPKKRIIELMMENLSTTNINQLKEFCPIFFRSPKIIESDAKGILYTINKCVDDIGIPTNVTEFIETDILLRSIGYTSHNIIDELNFDDKYGIVKNVSGRVLKKVVTSESVTSDISNDKFENGLYVTGWLGTGPTGVILTTLNNSFSVAKKLCEDIQSNKISDLSKSKPGIDSNKFKDLIVLWDGWKKIDKFEIEMGSKLGKPREKIIDINKMIEIAH